MNVFKIFQSSINEINKEVLKSSEEIIFNKELNETTNILNKDISNKFLSIEIEIETAESKGIFDILIEPKVALSIEYLMLMGQIEFDDKLIITEATVDAVQEYLQMILKKTSTKCENDLKLLININISEIKIIESILDINIDKLDKYNTFEWKYNDKIKIDETIYILYDSFTSIFLNDDSLENTEKYTDTSDKYTNITNNNFNNDNITIEIEDCDNRKKIYREELDNLKLLLGVELKLSVKIGSKRMLLKDVVNLDIGKTIELEQLSSEPLEILVNEIKIAEGDIVVVNGKFGVQITKISSKVDRLTKLRFKV